MVFIHHLERREGEDDERRHRCIPLRSSSGSIIIWDKANVQPAHQPQGPSTARSVCCCIVVVGRIGLLNARRQG